MIMALCRRQRSGNGRVTNGSKLRCKPRRKGADPATRIGARASAATHRIPQLFQTHLPYGSAPSAVSAPKGALARPQPPVRVTGPRTLGCVPKKVRALKAASPLRPHAANIFADGGRSRRLGNVRSSIASCPWVFLRRAVLILLTQQRKSSNATAELLVQSPRENPR